MLRFLDRSPCLSVGYEAGLDALVAAYADKAPRIVVGPVWRPEQLAESRSSKMG